MRAKKNVDTSNFSDTNELKFKNVETLGTTDVFYKNQRIAIINGFSSALQFTAKNGSNIPNQIIDKVENLVKRNLIHN